MNTYKFTDLFLDHATNRASLDALLTVFFATITAGYIVARILGYATVDLSTELIATIGIFVVSRGTRRAMQAYESSVAIRETMKFTQSVLKVVPK